MEAKAIPSFVVPAEHFEMWVQAVKLVKESDEVKAYLADSAKEPIKFFDDGKPIYEFIDHVELVENAPEHFRAALAIVLAGNTSEMLLEGDSYAHRDEAPDFSPNQQRQAALQEVHADIAIWIEPPACGHAGTDEYEEIPVPLLDMGSYYLL